MATTKYYASPATVESILGLATGSITDEQCAEASLDIDLYGFVGDGHYRDTSTDLRLTKTDLLTAQQKDLERATAYQVAYRTLMGAEYWTQPQAANVSIDGVSYDQKHQPLDPRAERLLARAGLSSRLGVAGSRTGNHSKLWLVREV